MMHIALTAVLATVFSWNSMQSPEGTSLKPATAPGWEAMRKSVIKIYPNPTENGSVTVNSLSDEQLYFYVFDLEGTLISRLILKGREKKTINDLKKGIYMYDVFREDESVEQGRIIVK
ncbi:MAG TPA: T9SS type A sorting domain-containing protein [Chitinophagaceae bacterium]|jgi:hypothetical protein|nr:T9SS type A sorting domain-containing protein [Chitinophagaceae bacterium]